MNFFWYFIFSISTMLFNLAIAASPEESNVKGESLIINRVITDSIFSADSFWYKPIPFEVSLHPNSAAFVADFLRQKKSFYGTVSINTKSYSSPVYVVGNDIHYVRVTQWDCQKRGYTNPGLLQQFAAVPMPEYAEPAKGTDSEMTIYQPSSDTIWEFWNVRKSDGKWQACWGGMMRNASDNMGNWPEIYGTTATGLPFLGGQITAEELTRGEIRHVIGIALVEVEDARIFSWPAKRSDGVNSQGEPNRIPEGLRFRLDPKVNVDSLQMHPVGKVIAKAAQKYGFVVWDKGGAIGIRAQGTASYTALGKPDPYPVLFAGTPVWAILNGFPWDKLQFLPMNYGKP